MKKDQVLVALVVADVFLAFAVIGSEMFFQWTLPRALRGYEISYLPDETAWGVARFLLWSASVGCTLVAWVGLVNLWWFARRLYLFAWASWTLLVLLSGPTVLTPLAAMFSTGESIVGGAILGLVYFSELSRHFERGPLEVATPREHATA